ncbi:hypothetical protein GCM10007939_00710 [Amylibacter marinus]|uniref:Prepilin type IV endopeptidase peptidase domain-containing protein n=1 Tax=Amylibacter marinus TaxID=1475483 RepID=A0ABQ5VQV0_9RHOB|nr:prepilin peptidase [Amylibacter marinus]GLQ33788.1 hypothetical protein GCM10007939_00710 [Amylibacter marinus]
MSEFAALFFLIATFPVLFICAYTDLRFMTISNRANMILFGIFLVFGVFLLPFPEYGMRLLQGVVMLIVGFLLTSFGAIGGGDSKLLAAVAPYVLLDDASGLAMVLCVIVLAAVLAHRILGLIPRFRAEVVDWVSWQKHRNFPFGVPIAATLFLYLFSEARIVN